MECLRCGIFDIWEVRDVECLECGMFGHVGCLGCQMWDVGCLLGYEMLVYKMSNI